jgi:hypothetical protein
MPSGPPELHEKWCKHGPTGDGCNNVLDTIDKLRAERVWQPIETAPGDELIWLYCPHDGRFLGKRFTTAGNKLAWRVMAYEWQAADDLEGRSIFNTTATHWQPLPQPPGETP